MYSSLYLTTVIVGGIPSHQLNWFLSLTYRSEQGTNVKVQSANKAYTIDLGLKIKLDFGLYQIYHAPDRSHKFNVNNF
jgi:hypothetical protein